MECPCRWAYLSILIYLAHKDANVLCQNILPERKSATILAQPQIRELKREITQGQNPIYTNAELMNALFSFASAKGILPNTAPIIQPAPSLEQSQVTTIQNVPKTFNVVPLLPPISSQCEKKPLVVSGAPVVVGSSIPNLVIAPTVNALQPTLITEPVFTSSPKIPQLTLENYPAIQPSRTIWQISQPVSELNNCIPVLPAQITEAAPPPINLQITPPSPVLPAINIESGNLEQASRPSFGILTEERPLITSDSKMGVPLNLQINIPSPIDPGPKITIITAAPLSSPAASEPIPIYPTFGLPSPQPIIMRKSRSSLRKLLPILMLTLFNDRGYSGGCGCSCNCGCDSDNPIPIPYPIPIPINNPIIST